jgi:outer membrane immunogenic protein
MKKIALAVALSVLGASTSFAADMAVKAAPVAQVYNWTGFYIGGTVGAVWGNANRSYSQTAGAPFDPIQMAPINFGSTDSVRFVGGVHGGYNWQVAPTWVLGIEGDVSGFAGGDHYSGPVHAIGNDGIPLATGPGNNVQMSYGEQWFATIRGRAGYAMDNWLFYATGGATFAGINYNGGVVSTARVGSIQTGVSSHTETGWVAAGWSGHPGVAAGWSGQNISITASAAERSLRPVLHALREHSMDLACSPGDTTITRRFASA